jgi:hypothetical protein
LDPCEASWGIGSNCGVGGVQGHYISPVPKNCEGVDLSDGEAGLGVASNEPETFDLSPPTVHFFEADMVDKAQILRGILDRLSAEFEADRATSKMTRAAGNDAETKSEGKYDTRSTEENYLADGLAKKAFAAAQSAKAYRDLPADDFGSDQPIDIGALVELSFDGERSWFFLGPAAGGMEIECEGRVVTVITRGSPLGDQIYRKNVGDWTSSPRARIESVR